MQPTYNPHASNTQGRDQFYVVIEAWLDRVRRDRDLLPNAFHVAYEVSLHFNRERFYETSELLAWPAVDTIKTGTGLGRNTVRRMLDALADAGHLATESGLGRSNQNHYRGLLERVPHVGTLSTEHVTLKSGQSKTTKSPKNDDKESHLAGLQPADRPADHSHESDTVEIAKHTHVRGKGDVGERGLADPYMPSRLDASTGPEGGTNGKAFKPVNGRAASTAALQSEFEKFWTVYPEHLGITARNREMAFKQFQKIRAEGISFDKLVTAARDYEVHERRNPNPDPMFIKVPWRWLKERRFEDEF
jgi:hypothetical protein